MNRRDVLRTAAASLALPGFRASSGEPTAPVIRDEDPETLAKVAEALQKAGVRTGKPLRTQHYLVFDDPESHLSAMLGRFCEAHLAAASRVFTGAGFDVRKPTRRMTVVAMTPDSFSNLAKQQGVNPAAYGYYDTSWRTCFFYPRHQEDDTSQLIDWESTCAHISHEITHQFSYNLGLLNPDGDIPAAISEGLAIVGETRSKDAPRLLRQANTQRLDQLVQAESRGLISLREFLLNDDHLWGKQTHLDTQRWGDSYALAWLLVYVLLTESDLRPKFRDYLKTTATREDEKHRMEDIKAHFGSVEILQKRILARLRRLIANPPSKYTSVRRASKP